MIIIDIDNFKYINDTYGHLCGDIVLQKIAQALLEVSHPLDIFGRVGGDEFLTLIKYPKSIEKVAEYCQNMIKSTSKVEYQGTHIITSISVGAVVSSVSLSYDELYRLADDALYRVKTMVAIIIVLLIMIKKIPVRKRTGIFIYRCHHSFLKLEHWDHQHYSFPNLYLASKSL